MLRPLKYMYLSSIDVYKDNMNIYYRYWLSRTDHNKLIFVQMYIPNPMHFKNIVYV